MKKANNSQIAKFQSQGVAQVYLIFCQFQPSVAYKSVAYKKKRVAKSAIHVYPTLNQKLVHKTKKY